MEKIKITTYCGLDCDNCELKKKCNCGGCVSTEGKPFHGECEVAKCCISRGRQFCGDCWEYPCKKLKSFSYDSEHGDNGERLKNCDRIKANLVACAREGLEPIAYCGFSCNHCFLGKWCGSCRSDYNLCSFASLFPDGICPNVKCCKENNFEGCWECEKLSECENGFYKDENDGSKACKAQAIFIKKYGKAKYTEICTKFHEINSDMKKVQEVLNGSVEEGLKILENLM